MFIYAVDQKRLWLILGLTDRDELQQSNNSQLYRLMTELDAFDQTNSAGLVNLIQQKMQEIEALNVQIETVATTRSIKTEESYLDGSITWEGKSEISVLKRKRDALTQRVRELIDPCGCFVVHQGYANVIAT
jgi:hypothetical protein